MLIEPFPLVLALVPLAAYLLLIGCIRLFAAPVVTTVARDLAALAIGISGLVAIGPAELFFPAPAAAAMGAYVWLVLLLFYVLAVSLLLLSMPPKLMVYGLSPDALLDPLHRAAMTLDPGATVDPQRRQVHLPQLGVHLRIEGNPLVHNVQVAAFEPNLAPAFWSRLLAALRVEVNAMDRARQLSGRLAGIVPVLVGLLLCVPIVIAAVSSPEQVVAGFKQWLWR